VWVRIPPARHRHCDEHHAARGQRWTAFVRSVGRRPSIPSAIQRMTKSSLVLPVLTVATVAIAACGGSSGSSTTTTPAPAPASSASSAPAAAARPATGGLPSGVTTAMVTMGDSLFHASSCVRCHGPDAKGRQNGPDLTSGHFMHLPTGSYNEIVTIITNGVPADSIKDPSHRLPMRGRGGANLTDDQIKAIAAYVYKLSHS